MNLDATRDCILAMRSRRTAIPPEILIEIYFEDTDDLAAQRERTTGSTRDGLDLRTSVSAGSHTVVPCQGLRIVRCQKIVRAVCAVTWAEDLEWRFGRTAQS